MVTRSWMWPLVATALLAYACSGNSNTPSPIVNPPVTPPVTTPPPPAPTAFLVGAGDIADCRPAPDGNLGAASEATAKLIEKMTEASVFTMGDNQYFFGSSAEY